MDNWLMVRKNRKITRHLTVGAWAMTYPAVAKSAGHQSPRAYIPPRKKVALMEKVNKYAAKQGLELPTDKKFRLILNWPLTHDIDTIELRSVHKLLCRF